MNILNEFLRWLRDPFGRQDISRKHTEIQKRMLAATVRAKDTSKEIEKLSNPIEKVVLGDRHQSS